MLATMQQEQNEETPKIISPELHIPAAVSSSSNASPSETATVGGFGSSSHQMQYCDACNTACVFMNGRRRKLQVRYEGYVLVKRVPTASSFMRASLPYVTAQHAPYERRHSFADILDEQQPAGEHEPGCAGASGGAATAATILQQQLSRTAAVQIPWRKPDDDFQGPRPHEKLVNLMADDNSSNSARISLSTSSSTLSMSQGALIAAQNLARRRGPGGGAGEKKIRSHPRLSRKKSRSQDNLSARRINTDDDDGTVLNNTIQPPPLTSSPLSRSEGSIHNVHAITLTGEEGLHGEPACGGVGELARLPKKLLSRVTDEVGQWVFDLEGWNEQYLTLGDSTLSLRNSYGDAEVGLEVPYSGLEEVQVVLPCGAKGHKYCIRLVTRDTSLLLQASSSYTRDQWLHSILWKKNAFKYRNLLRTARRPEVLLKELKNLVEVSLAAPLHDPAVCQLPLDLASSILTGDAWLSQPMSEEVIVTLAPLLENNTPSPQICSFFSKHCCDAPRSTLVIDMFTPVVRRILKHNVDFGKYPHVRRFVQNYIQALNSQNAGETVVLGFVRSLHGPTSTCPHLRVLPNLVSVCTAAINTLTETSKRLNINDYQTDESTGTHMACYLSLLGLICEYDDWRPGLAALLQPVPFPDDFLAETSLIRHVVPVIERIGRDPRCEVHQLVASSREHKEGWLQLLCPSSIACVDEGAAWASVLQTLISCCCRRKKFLASQTKSLGAFMLLALRSNATAQEVLCLMLEWRLIESNDLRLQVVTTLQSTSSGKRAYQDLCDRQLHLRELQQKGGPRKLTLPSRSTDADVIRLLSSGSFGNLQVLSLAFTRVTSECAHQLIKLPDLRYLNLWATQFGDQGLQLISEHLHKLQVLNLCETPVTDLGLASVTALKNLRKLNLNSTSLSVDTFQELKASLPALQEVDVRYTDAW